MPIYEYSCSDCGKRFEALRSIKDSDQSIACKYCNSNHTQRAISVCYAHGIGTSTNTSYAGGGGGGCSGCSGGSCGSCHH